MPEISLKKVRKEGKDLVAPEEMPKEMYPNFTVYEDPPPELMKLNIGDKRMAEIVVVSKEVREGKNQRESIGFDVLSVQNYKEGEDK